MGENLIPNGFSVFYEREKMEVFTGISHLQSAIKICYIRLESF